MIRVICPECKSTLNAKDELAGQTRKCPNCANPVLIPKEGGKIESLVQQPAGDSAEASLLTLDVPQRLSRLNRYLICDNRKLVATWESNGPGWMLKTSGGLIPARRNPDQLPNRGDFKLIELQLVDTDDGLRLVGITSYQLATEWALIALERGDHNILSKVTGPGHLNKEQKNLVRQAIRDQLMHQVWGDATNVLEYLASTDYHSPGT